MNELRFAVDYGTKHLIPTLYHYRVNCETLPLFTNENSAVYLRDALGYEYRIGNTELPSPRYPAAAPYRPNSIIVFAKPGECFAKYTPNGIQVEKACTAYLYYDVPRLADLAFAILFSRGADRLGLDEITIEKYIMEGAKTILPYTNQIHSLLPLVVLSPMRSKMFWDGFSSEQILRKCEKTMQKASERDFQGALDSLKRDALRLIETKLVEA